MVAVDSVKNRLIDRILVTKNEKFLEAIEKIFDTIQNEEEVALYPEQKEMLLMSEMDIENGNLVSEEELEKTENVNSLFVSK